MRAAASAATVPAAVWRPIYLSSLPRRHSSSLSAPSLGSLRLLVSVPKFQVPSQDRISTVSPSPPLPTTGRAATVVVPLAGYLLPQVWRPARSSAITLVHDLTIRDGSAICDASSPDQAIATSGKAASSIATELANHRRALIQLWVNSGALERDSGQAYPETGPVSVSVLGASPRVVYLPVPQLQERPWRPGQACVEDIFDA